MKPHHAMFLGIAIGLVAGALLMLYTRTPCPDLSVPPPSQAIIVREAVRDSIAERRATRRQLLDSLADAIKSQPDEQALRIILDLSAQQQLDSLRSKRP